MVIRPPAYPIEAPRPTLVAEMLGTVATSDRSAIILAAAIDAAVSLCTSAIARVRRHDGTAGPVFSFDLLVSPTGAGKTHQDRKVKPPINEFIDEHSAVTADELSYQESESISHKAKVQRLANKIGNDFVEGVDVTSEKDRLKTLIADAPTVRTMPDWLYDEVTMQALLRGLHNFPVAALWVDDADFTLNMMARQGLSLIAKLWDEGTLSHNRVANGRMNIHAAFTMYLTIQNEIYADFLAKHGKRFITMGVAGRCLPYVVTPEMMYSENIDDSISDNGIRERLAARVKELLAKSVVNATNGLDKLPVLELTEEAKDVHKEFRRKVQATLRGPEWADCTGFVAKMPDHVIRLAARWHLFEGLDGDLSGEYLRAAIQVVEGYHLPTYQFLHAKPPRERQEAQDADLLLGVLHDAVRHGRSPTRSELMNLAFNAGISSASRFGGALGLLGAEKKVEVSRNGRVHLNLPNRAQRSPDAPHRIVLAPNMDGRFDEM